MVSRCALTPWLARQSSGIVGAIVACLLALPSVTQAEETYRIVRVEEDWELVVANADPDLAAPQVTCAISPTGDIHGLYAAIELNYRSQPSFAAGGLQLQVWSGEQLLAAKSFTNNSPLATPGERIRWTQAVSVNDGNVTFEITNGSSATWGELGSDGYLKVTVESEISNLNRYHPKFSVEQSGVGYAGNRVESLTLKEVRLIMSSGTVLRDTTPRVVHQH